MTTDSPLTDASTNLLAAAVEENLFALFRAMVAVLPDGEIAEGERLSRHLTFPHNPMFKGVWATRLEPEDVDAAIDETIGWFEARAAPFFFWWTGPGTRPSDLGERLMARGLISMEEQQRELAPGIVQTAAGAPGMVADLHRMNEAALKQVPEAFVIEEVADEAALHAFRDVFVEVYEIPAWAGQAWVDATLSAGIGRTPWKMYLGRLGGAPVATNMLFNGGGVASVYAVGTVPAFRGKGIGGAITLRPLLDAREMGYRHAVLFSTEMGVGAYERIGFVRTDARINRYLWRSGSA
jgi:ribosomal protein S18 acetylase RimI-like enzyme